MVADIRRTSAELAEVTGVTAGGLDLDRRWTECRDLSAAPLSAAMVDVSVTDAAQRDGVRLALARERTHRPAGSPLPPQRRRKGARSDNRRGGSSSRETGGSRSRVAVGRGAG